MKEVRIRAREGWEWINWRELWEARDLVWLLVRRDFVTKYAQTILGPLWFILQPLGLAVVLSLAINGGAGIETEGVPPFLYNLCSLTPWFYFSQTFGSIGATFVNNAELFRKVYFPRSAVPTAIALSNLLSLAIQAGLFVLVLVAYAVGGIWESLSWRVVLIPFLVIELMVLSLGTGLLVASLTARYRDLIHALQYLLLIIMFASLVFVPISSVPEHLRWMAWLNPLAVVVESTRWVLLKTSGVTLLQVAVSVVISLVILLAGLLFFERASHTAVDTV